MIINRTEENGSWVYADNAGNEIGDSEIMEYIKRLVIPPNYKDVKIFYQKTGHPKILYQGYDSKKRLQRIYSDAWKKKATRRKFCELLNLAEQINNISRKVASAIGSERLSKEKCISMILRIVMICYFRIGNKKYQELYGSFGAMNIQKRHIKFDTDSSGKEYMSIIFKGKKSVMNMCSVYDSVIIREIKKILKFRDTDEMVFKWLDHGVGIPIRAVDINAWLKSFDPRITSKDFRTYDANILLIVYLREQRDPIKLTIAGRRKIITASMKLISTEIHNTPAVLKKNYAAGGIIDMYIDQPTRFKRYFLSDNHPRQAFIKYLRDYCRGYKDVKLEIAATHTQNSAT